MPFIRETESEPPTAKGSSHACKLWMVGGVGESLTLSLHQPRWYVFSLSHTGWMDGWAYEKMTISSQPDSTITERSVDTSRPVTVVSVCKGVNGLGVGRSY